MTCLICDETFNKTIHTSIQCQYCDFTACRKCCETFILDKPVATCMKNDCRKEWTRKYINTVFTGKFVNGAWKANLENIYFEREKALLPATQGVLERINILEKSIELTKKIKDLKWEKQKFSRILCTPENVNIEFTKPCGNPTCNGYLDSKWGCGFCQKKTCFKCLVGGTDHTCKEEDVTTAKNMRKKVKENLKMQINEIQVHILRMSTEKDALEVMPRTSVQKTVQPLFTRGCPDAECRGFLNSSWKCGLCEKTTCKECHLIKQENHECNADDVATAKLLKSDTKPCPKCSTGIYKIDGCDQMWCTQCHTAFSWKTGELQTNIHNPHYFEWQRRNGQNMRNPDDIICGHEINHHLVNSIREKLPFTVRESLRRKVDELIINIIHIRLVDMPNYRVDPVMNNEKLRIGYLRKEIDEEDFKKKVQRNNKLHEKKREIYGILHLFVQTATDIFHRLNAHIRTNSKDVLLTTDIEKHLSEIEAIRVYTNECLEDIATTYNQKQILLTEKVKLIKNPV